MSDPNMTPTTVYLGDQVYVDIVDDGYHVKLFTYDGIEITNVIYIEYKVWIALTKYVKVEDGWFVAEDHT